MTKPRFLLDEHINRAIQRQLRRLDIRIEVLAVVTLELQRQGRLTLTFWHGSRRMGISW